MRLVDPLGDSSYVESPTTVYEARIVEILREVEERGSTLKLIQKGWFQRNIADFAYDTAIRKQTGEKPVIGVNCLVDDTPDPKIEIHPYDQSTVDRQCARTRRVRQERDPVKLDLLLQQLVAVAKDPSQNILPITIELVRSGATMGDIIETLTGVEGTYRETPVF